MHFIDWFIIVSYLAWIIYDGLKRTKAADEIEGYFLAKRSMPWWAAGLSVMATQLSAITMVSTTGQGYSDGLRFVQFYFALPIAMVILSITLVPFFYRARVFTAYEYLERRFDPATRALASLLFLVSRGLQVGVTHRGARSDPLDHAGLGLYPDRACHWCPDRSLHNVRWRAGSDLDRRQADGRHRRRSDSPRLRP